MFRIQSRGGNRCIAAAGIVYTVTALPLLAWFVMISWGAESMIDRALQLALLGTVAIGIAFVIVARSNLRRLESRNAPGVRVTTLTAQAEFD